MIEVFTHDIIVIMKTREERRVYDREWKRQERLNNPNEVRAKAREKYRRQRKNPEWMKKHREYMRNYLKKWRKDNPKYAEQHREQMREWNLRVNSKKE